MSHDLVSRDLGHVVRFLFADTKVRKESGIMAWRAQSVTGVVGQQQTGRHRSLWTIDFTTQ